MRPAVVKRSGASSVPALSAVTRSLYRAVSRAFRCGNPTGFDAEWLPKRQVRFTRPTPLRPRALHSVGRVTSSSRATAWVESPLQLVCAVEYAALAGIPLRIVPRAGAAQIDATAERLRQLTLPEGVEICQPRAVPAVAASHAIIGDAFSGRVQSAMAVRMPRRLTIVDDGSASLALPAALAGSRPLSRTGVATRLSRLTRARLTDIDRVGDLELFSYYRLQHPAWIPNRFAWLASRHAEGLSGGAVVLGSANVVDGLLAEGVYLRWLASQPAGARYLPHRRESRDTIEAAALLGFEVVETGLPVELALLGSRGLEVSTLPSSAADTLRILLSGSGSRISVESAMARAA